MRVSMRWISRIIVSLTLPREERGLEDLLARSRRTMASSRSLVVMREAMVELFIALCESG